MQFAAKQEFLDRYSALVLFSVSIRCHQTREMVSCAPVCFLIQTRYVVEICYHEVGGKGDQCGGYFEGIEAESFLLMLHIDYITSCKYEFLIRWTRNPRTKGAITMQNDSGRKNMLTRVSNLMFSPNRTYVLKV